MLAYNIFRKSAALNINLFGKMSGACGNTSLRLWLAYY